MKCPSCEADFHGKFCKCGYAHVPGKAVERVTRVQGVQVRAELAARQAEVDRFVSEYRREHPEASYPEACLAYARRHGTKALDLFQAIVRPAKRYNDDYFEGR